MNSIIKSLPTLGPAFYFATMPVLLSCVGGVFLMLQSITKRFSSATAVYVTTQLFLVAAFISLFTNGAGQSESMLDGTVLLDNLGNFGQGVILTVSIVICALAYSTHIKDKFFRGEIASLFLMIVAGMLVMTTSEDFITLFIGLELSSIGLYAVVGYVDPSRKSQEAAIKYFVLGSFAAGFLLFGFALLYGSTGSMRLSEIVEALSRQSEHRWIAIGAIFTLVGMGFKLALAPFHMWAPDVYEGAPTVVTAFMATTVKVMMLIFALRLFAEGMLNLYQVWMPALFFLAAVSMILGNIFALVQTSLKRMLAYSSIAHSGYMAIALAAMGGIGNKLPIDSILFYIISYVVMSLGSFAIIIGLETDKIQNVQLDDLNGLGRKRPLMALLMTVIMFSFVGMPPTVGFMAKYFVFNAALTNQLYGLVIIGVIGSSISLYYYLRVIVRMYMTEPNTGLAGTGNLNMLSNRTVQFVAIVSVIVTLLLGTILPGPTLNLVRRATSNIVAH